MSKKHGQRRKRRNRPPKAKVICASCGAPQDGSPASLLQALALAMNACHGAGVDIKLRHGIVVSQAGYVLPLKQGRWTARTLAYDNFASAAAAIDDDFD